MSNDVSRVRVSPIKAMSKYISTNFRIVPIDHSKWTLNIQGLLDFVVMSSVVSCYSKIESVLLAIYGSIVKPRQTMALGQHVAISEKQHARRNR